MRNLDQAPLVLGTLPKPDFDCSAEPLPDNMRVLLWVIDGSERRQRLTQDWTGARPGRARAAPPRKQRRPG
jgi:hypothetical protein